ncbi:Venom metalloproteinase 3 [Orchesella cincta]|uniref:Venom metalloproteinase 3 n=1 Tax=Orchesella cincta TaxID=48709 RepID=A0A1D2M4C9_ORCCI|nr:Venom metalloproteinase 3 [Orchesella cincta]
MKIIPKYGIKSGSAIYLKVGSETGEQYNLKLSKPDISVLHPNIKVITVGTDRKPDMIPTTTGPLQNELNAAEDVYVDEKNLAAVRVNYDNGDRSMIGVVNGKRFEAKNDQTKLYESLQQNHSDYMVCDKEFGDVFQHDRVKILDYLTVYFWDINLRYKTLPSINLSFRVTGVVVISTLSGQPFIEESRAPDGRAEFGRILDRFKYWVYQQMSVVPKFDMAVAITNTALEWGGGLAIRDAACWVDNAQKRFVGTAVFNDGGEWGSLTVGTRNGPHTRAPHDDDPNFPGGVQPWIHNGGGNDDLRWFFSTCSDRTISNFVLSNQASCLRTINEPGNPPISPDFSFILAPTKADQCKRKLKNPNAFVSEVLLNIIFILSYYLCNRMALVKLFITELFQADIADCKVMKCRVAGDSRIFSFPPVDNSPCGGQSRCFRGRCRMPGSLIRNVGDGRCLKATDPFALLHHLSPSIAQGTPLDRFVISDDGIGKTLSTPWETRDATETGDKCIYTANAEGGIISTDRCSTQPRETRGMGGTLLMLAMGSSSFLTELHVDVPNQMECT